MKNEDILKIALAVFLAIIAAAICISLTRETEQQKRHREFVEWVNSFGD